MLIEVVSARCSRILSPICNSLRLRILPTEFSFLLLISVVVCASARSSCYCTRSSCLQGMSIDVLIAILLILGDLTRNSLVDLFRVVLLLARLISRFE